MTILDHVSPAAVATVHEYARSVRRVCGLHESSMAQAIADRVLGVDALRFLPVRGESYTARIGGREWLVIRSSLPRPRAHWAMATALARWLLAHDGVELHEGAVAGALLLPRDSVAAELRQDGADAVARRLIVPVYSALLRDGEIRTKLTAQVVVGDVVRLRGADAANVDELEAAASTKATPLRFTRRRSRDERGVVVARRAA